MDRVHEEVHGLGPQRWSMYQGQCSVYVPRLQAKVGTGPQKNKFYQRK